METKSHSLTSQHYFRQSPELLNGKYHLTKGEGDLLYALLTEIQKEDEDFKDYTFSKSQLELKLGVKLKTSDLRKNARSLMTKVFEVYRNQNDWELMGFSYFSYKNAQITCRFDKAMKPYLLELSQFINADIRHIVQMKGQYSQRIYLMLKEQFKFGKRKFYIKELMEQLEVPKSFKVYADFKRKVLMKAVKDINKFTDIEIKNLGTSKKPKFFEEHKSVRKIEAVTFYFKKNTNDLKVFIEHIRKEYTNIELCMIEEKIIKCSENGVLYNGETMKTFTKEVSQKYWDKMWEMREELFHSLAKRYHL